jgi:hypothetical protein
VQPLLAAVANYIHEVLGLEAAPARLWSAAQALPYFLHDGFEFAELELLGKPLVLAIERPSAGLAQSEVRKRLVRVAEVAGQPVAYVTQALASFERRRLIEHKLPFIVPGNQLYLPHWGLDLREYFRQRSVPPEAGLSPSAQALWLAAQLHQPWQPEWQATELAAPLGFAPMRVSRAARELVASGLAEPYSMGRARWLRFGASPTEAWNKARPLLRSPVKRSIWVATDPGKPPKGLRLAGLSALARRTMLSEPPHSVHALLAADWPLAQASGARELPEPEPGAQAWQLWSYQPALVPEETEVDPLSLILSLQHETDDRTQLALAQLEDELPW